MEDFWDFIAKIQTFTCPGVKTKIFFLKILEFSQN